MRQHKTYPVSHFKALDTEAAGTFEAIVSVFGNVDLVGDRVVKGAFEKNLAEWRESGDPIPVIWSHQWDNLDAHVGKVTEAEERDEGLWVKGQLDMDEDFARRLWRKMQDRTIKEFSFAYDVVRERTAKDGANELLELNLIEVGPTLKGANPETRLLGVKAAIAAHSSETSADAWDGATNEANLSNDAGAETYRQAFAWMDPDGDPEVKASYRFIHHFVSDDGQVGPASVRACITGIGVLNGGRGGTTIPDSDRQGVYNHLAKHLRDAGQEPPPLRDASDIEKGADMSEVKAGRVLSAKNESKIRDAVKMLTEVLASLPSEEPKAESPTTNTTNGNTSITVTIPRPTEKSGSVKSEAKDDEPQAKSDEPKTMNPRDLRLMAEALTL